MFPALERSLELNTAGPLVLLSSYQTPAVIRRLGTRRLTAWLRNRKVRNAEALAVRAVEAAERQHTAVAGEAAIARMVRTLVKEVMSLNEKVTETDKLIEGRFREHELAEVILSMPGIGGTLGAEFLASVGGSLDAFPTPDRLAAFAGLAPAPRDSGQVSGNLHRPQRYVATATRLLHFRAAQHPFRPELAPVLRPQTGRRQTPHPGRPRFGTQACQRPLGPHPRPTLL